MKIHVEFGPLETGPFFQLNAEPGGDLSDKAWRLRRFEHLCCELMSARIGGVLLSLPQVHEMAQLFMAAEDPSVIPTLKRINSCRR